MYVLFVSHASRDDALARGLEAWLKANGFTNLFVDHSSIGGGDKWRDALKEAAGSCRVVLCLVTGNWLASSECFNEFRAAWYMGKRIVPLFLLGAAKLNDEAKKRLAEVQAEDQGFDLTPCLGAKGVLDIEKGGNVARLLRTGLHAAGALARVGLDPEAFEIDRKLRPTPFPGLAAFGDEDADAALFYGRSREIAETLEEVRAMRARGLRLLVILGASGAGKSSLLRAGIIPRLRREAPAWLPLRAFRPGADPLFNFAEALARTLKDFGKTEAPGAIHDRLMDNWSKAARNEKNELTELGRAAIEDALDAEGTRLRQAAGRQEASLLIGVDQAEELARAEDRSGEALADYLRAALAARSIWRLVFTIRTDSFAELQGHPRFQNLEARMFDLRAIPTFRFDNVIEQPARRYDVETETELIDALMNDAPKEDALPLLAFALQRLWHRYAATGRLTKTHYDNVGGLKGLIEDAAERALRGIEPGQDVALPPGEPTKRALDVGAAAFLSLAQINDQGATIRQVPEWKSFDDEARDLLSRFGRWRLVVRRGEAEGGTVEVAHEALFREWSRLKAWLEPERARLEALHGLQSDAATWERKGRSRDFLNHRDKRLAEARALKSNANYAKRLKPAELDYLESCQAADRRRKMLVGMLALLLAAGGVGWWHQDVLRQLFLERYQWRMAMGPNVLTAEMESEKAAKPGSAFTECKIDCPEMVVVPADKLFMGSPETEANRFSDEGRQRWVTFAKPFAVGKFEVTFAQWDRCIAAGACPKVSDSGWGGDDRPVIHVTWDEAKLYVAWLSRITGKPYRLLTEAEWEYAARARTTTAYSFGVDDNQLDQYAWYIANSDGRTQPVGKKKANGFGLHDMHGNVWEWVEDCYVDNYNNAPKDGTAVTSGDCSRRVVRGGSWDNFSELLRSAIRIRTTPVNRNDDLGFRVSRTLTP